jgi:hypothetical protein
VFRPSRDQCLVPQDGFDPIRIIVDWLDACREGRFAALIERYEDGTIEDCCQGGTFRGRLGVERYWSWRDIRVPVNWGAPNKLCIAAFLKRSTRVWGVQVDLVPALER